MKWIIIIVSVVLFTVITLLGYGAYKSIMDQNAKLRNEIVEFKQLTETLVRSSNKWVTKDELKDNLSKLLSAEDLKEIYNDIRRQGAQLSAVGRTVGLISNKIAKLEVSDTQGPENTDTVSCNDGRLIDVHGYTKRSQIKRLEDVNKAPVADVEFNAVKSKPWTYEVFGRRYTLATVVSKKDSGQLVFHHKLTYAVPKIDNKEYPIEITSSQFIQTKLGSKFFWLNPKLDIALFGGASVFSFTRGPGNPDNVFSLGADLGISLSSYGETKLDSWWRFFRFGAGYDARRNAGRLSLAPVLYNVGKSLPFLTNLYIGPNVGIDSAGGLGVGINLGPQL